MPEQSFFAFVLMPFDPNFDDIYRLGIKEPAAEMDVNAERVDEQIFAEGILERIYRQIDAADMVIADMSGQNPNVFYEVGYAHARDKLCILLTKDASDIPFDLKHRRHVVYGESIRHLRELLSKEIEWAKTQIDNVRKSRIRVALQRLIGDLTQTAHTRTADLNFTVDLHNDSDVPSSEIEAIYLHTSDKWNVYQGDQLCSRTSSDLAPFNARHFLNAPIKRLQRNGWAQLRFRTSRRIAASWDGDELKDSYPIKGRSVLQIVTDKGAFDYPLDIDLTVEVFPF